MRADNNWEDSVGKRLFDYTGEPSAQAWKNINGRINQKPRQRWRWLWLPALLLFIALPVAFYLLNKPTGEQTSGDKQIAQTEKNKTGISPKNQGAAAPALSPATARNASSEELPAPVDGEKKANEKHTTSGAALVQPAGNPQLAANPENKKRKVTVLPVLPRENDAKPEAGKENTGKETRRAIALNNTPKVAGPKKNTDKAMPEPAEKTAIATNPAVSQTSPEEPKSAHSTQITLNNQKEMRSGGQEKAASRANEQQEKTDNPEATNQEKDREQPAEQDTEPDNLYARQAEMKAPGKQSVADSLAPEEEPAAVKPAIADTTQAPAETKPEPVKKWQFSIYASPQYTYQRVRPNLNDEVLVLRMNNQNKLESERLGYEFGFRSLYPVSEKLRLETGFHFTRLNQYLDLTTAGDQADSTFIDQQNGSVLLNIRHHEENQILLFKYYMAGLYAGADLSLGKQWSVTGGLGANWLLWKNPDEKTIPVETKSLNPYVSTSLRYYRPLTGSVALTMGPTVQYYVRAVQRESAWYSSKPTTFGFSVGLLLQR